MSSKRPYQLDSYTTVDDTDQVLLLDKAGHTNAGKITLSDLIGPGLPFMRIGPGGALQSAGVGNGSIVGGPRGTGAVDLQTSRSSSAQTAFGDFATIAGGRNNGAYGNYGFIGGGRSNNIFQAEPSTTPYGFIGGGMHNTVNGSAGAIVAGNKNHIGVGSSFSFIGCGSHHVINSYRHYATIAGGSSNRVDGTCGFVGGGANNICGDSTYPTVGANYGAIGGGLSNTISYGSTYSFIGGGRQNQISANKPHSVIGGGYNNLAQNHHVFIGGGTYNTASGTYSVVVGGYLNQATAAWSFIGNGDRNSAQSTHATLVGGSKNNISVNGAYGFIGGGSYNYIDAHHCTIAGGGHNSTGAYYGTIGGGTQNTAYGHYSTVPGGYKNSIYAGAHFGFAAGRRVKIHHAGATGFSDSQDADFTDYGVDTFNARFQGGVFFKTPIVHLNNGSQGGTIASPIAEPADITADQDDWNPGVARTYEIQTNGTGIKSIHGLGIGQADGQECRFINKGTDSIKFTNETVSSTASNRFHSSTGADLTMTTDQSIDAVWSQTKLRWRIFLRT